MTKKIKAMLVTADDVQHYTTLEKLLDGLVLKSMLNDIIFNTGTFVIYADKDELVILEGDEIERAAYNRYIEKTKPTTKFFKEEN